MSITKEQLAARATGVGASEVAIALGMSPYATPFDLYLAKRGEVAAMQEETRPMRFGNAVEPFILSEFEREHPELGSLVRAPDTMRRGAMLAHLDAWVPGRCNVQAKTARDRRGWGESGSPDVPQHYLLQVQAEMLLANVSVSFVPVLFGGADYDEFVVEADRELQELVEDGVHDFWQRVERGEPPEPVTAEDAIARWGRSARAGRVVADDNVLAALAELREMKARREQLEGAEERAKAIVMAALRDADTLVDASGKTLVTWKQCAGAKRFDAEALKAAHPELAAKFIRQGDAYRRFILKD